MWALSTPPNSQFLYPSTFQTFILGHISHTTAPQPLRSPSALIFTRFLSQHGRDHTIHLCLPHQDFKSPMSSPISAAQERGSCLVMGVLEEHWWLNHLHFSQGTFNLQKNFPHLLPKSKPCALLSLKTWAKLLLPAGPTTSTGSRWMHTTGLNTQTPAARPNNCIVGPNLLFPYSDGPSSHTSVWDCALNRHLLLDNIYNTS